jgi:putative addiction module component (TIGR02574 family)
MASSPVDLSRLSVPERLALLEELWDSLASEHGAAPISPELAAELDRRLADVERDPDAGSPWADVRARIEQRRR